MVIFKLVINIHMLMESYLLEMMIMESKNTQMDLYIQENFTMVINMEEVNLSIVMVVCILVILLKIYIVVMVNLNITIKLFMKVNGSMDKCMV